MKSYSTSTYAAWTRRLNERNTLVPRPSPLVPRAFTLVELLVVITIIGILIALLLPAVQAAREAARRLQCANGMHQAAIALHHFHDRKGHFPHGQNQDIPLGAPSSIPWDKSSWLQGILPDLEQQPLYDNYVAHLEKTPPGTPYNGSIHGGTWWVPGRWEALDSLHCPSDDVSPKVRTAGWSESPGTDPQLSQGFNGNVVACSGSTVFNPSTDPTGRTLNGIFYAASETRVADIDDGTSHTLMLGEIVVVEDIMMGIQIPGGQSGAQRHDFRGRYWNSQHGNALFSTLYPPNTPVGDRQLFCISAPQAPCQTAAQDNQVMSLRSYHPGGVNVAMADGSVHFLADYIDALVYRNLGTRAGGEIIPSGAVD